MLNRFSSFWYIVAMEISIIFKNKINQTSIFFNNWGNFHIDKIKGRSIKRQLKRLGIVQKKLDRTNLSTVNNDNNHNNFIEASMYLVLTTNWDTQKKFKIIYNQKNKKVYIQSVYKTCMYK